MADKTLSARKPVDRLGSIVTITQDMPDTVIKQLTINAIIRHRELLAEAEVWGGEEPRGWDVSTPEDFRYVEAMINMLAQMDVLSLLLDRLGYIPEVPGDQVN